MNATGKIIGRLSHKELEQMIIDSDDKEFKSKILSWLEFTTYEDLVISEDINLVKNVILDQ